MTTVLISQSNYIPWRGYFDLIAAADRFIILDDVQYTHQDWRNRNQIKTPGGLSWLTIPIRRDGGRPRICEVVVGDPRWSEKHWRRLEPAYETAACFAEAAGLLRPLYERAAGLTHLSDINRLFLDALLGHLGVETRVHRSTDFFPLEKLDQFDKNQRVLELCRAVGATRYVAGPSARSYMDLELFERSGIQTCFADYGKYPEYPQLHGPFMPTVSIIDLVFSVGKKAREYTVGFAV
jgi:hypothetical protein